MDESDEIRLKRLRMRSMRRGIKEMDILLSRFAEELEGLSQADLDTYDQLLDEGDQDLLAWVMGTAVTPGKFRKLISAIKTSGA